MIRPPLSDYPFEPDLDWREVYKLEGLDKLRCVRDPVLRQELYELYWVVQDNETDPRKRARAEAWERSRIEDERQALLSTAERARAGELGRETQQLVEFVLADDSRHGAPLRTDIDSLREFERERLALPRKGR